MNAYFVLFLLFAPLALYSPTLFLIGAVLTLCVVRILFQTAASAPFPKKGESK